MDLNLSVGMAGEKSEVVTGDNTAIKYGSGSVAVYATPAMIGLMEGAAVQTVDPHLPEGMGTVGVEVKVRHTAATPVGLGVRATTELTQIDGKRLVFAVKAFDEEGTDRRGDAREVCRGIERFLEKAGAKGRETGRGLRD